MQSILSSTTLLLGVLATSVLANPQYGDSGSSSPSTTSSVSAAAASAASNVHSVKVGPALTFSPDTVSAAVGDWVEFTFTSGHSVAQSSFDSPCVPLSGGGFYSGFPNAGEVWRVQVNDTNPVWVYCSASGHCEGGMVMVINQASSGSNTLDAYKSAAANAQASSPETVAGGVFGALADSAPSSSASGSATPTAAATGSSSSGNGAGSNVVSSGLMVLGAIAAGAAAYL